MDIYNTIASWTGWPLIVALLILAGGYGYWLLNSQVELIKNENEFLKQKLADSTGFTPDVLSQRLAERVKILSDELERLHVDSKVSKETIAKKEQELFRAVSESINHALIRLRFASSEASNLLPFIVDADPRVRRSIADIQENILLAAKDLRFALVNEA